MVIPRIVPDSRPPPPVLLISAGAALLAGLIIRSLKRRHRRASSSRGVEVSSTGRTVRKPASSRAKGHRALLAASTGSHARVTSSHAAVCEK
ncbi:hypothetical protein [Hyalangium gracile]|uniref:hypothetical protein n=1 Tax=Hyalangium gracile TaxID=394092 RepID=UPI001CCECE3E|nr:hypothetical protein [Hyalangium gracile]